MAVARPPTRKQRRIEELQKIVRQRFPTATFEVMPVPDVRGVTGIWAYIPVDIDGAEAENLRTVLRDREFEIMLSDRIQLLTILREDRGSAG